MFSTIALISVLTLSLIYLLLKHKYNYWKRKKLPYPEPTLLFGNYGPHILQKEMMGKVVQKICERFPNEAFVGAFVGTKPVLIPASPQAVKLITTQAFPYFNSRVNMDYSEKDIVGRGIVNMHGKKWKSTRTALSPMFSSVKLKNMFYLTEKSIDSFEKYLETFRNRQFEARALMASYTLSVFVSCAFGIEVNYGERSDFNKLADNFFVVHWIRGVFLSMRMIWPGLFFGLGFKLLPDDLEIYFKKLLKEVFEARGNKPSGRNDFVDGLLKIKETADADDDYIVAQCVAIFLAGFETSATTLGFLLYELAKNEQIQAKAQNEVDNFLEKLGGKMTFESLSDLPYLEACISETLRRYPVFTTITREVSEDFTLPSGSVLEKGLRVHIPVYYLHHNPEYFPNPEEFLPERFFGDTEQKIVPYSFLPFGEGPRVCIGKRFAMIQSLSALVTVLKKYKVVLAEGMTGELEFEPQTITTTAKHGIHLKLLPRT